ncbi:MAG: ATP-binding cassette domain-containing protein [Spirosomataceae bacterium]
MQSEDILQVIKYLLQLVELPYDPFKKQHQLSNRQTYSSGQIKEFIADLILEARDYDLTLVEHSLDQASFEEFVAQNEHPVVVFEHHQQGVTPIVIGKDIKKNTAYQVRFENGVMRQQPSDTSAKYYQTSNQADETRNFKVLFLAVFPMQALVSQSPSAEETKPLKPLQRLFRLLENEKKDISYIYIYAIVTGLISLTLPLGIQAIIGLISGGLVFSSVYLLVGLVIVGIIFTGILQIVQISLVETLQRRIFVKAAYEFTYRIPRIRAEALLKYYPPELMNRFFDILTVQKALPKLLIDVTAALVQVIFGITLLSFYHPFFIVFGVLTVLLVGIVIRINAPKGLETSIFESKYKYKIAQWLEDIARLVNSFKMAGSTNLPMQKTDYLVNNYLKYRKKHFRILVILFANAVAFKALVTGSLLIMGTILVVDRQITLGQFVASEIVIVLVVGAVEKLISTVDIIFDMLTALEKLGNVTDLPLERQGGIRFQPNGSQGLHVNMAHVAYRYPEAKKKALKNINLEILPGERVCITGSNDAGKETLLKVLSGIYTDFDGVITFNGFSIRDIDLVSLRDVVDKNISADDIFDGSLLDNLTIGTNGVTVEQLRQVVDDLNLTEAISQLPEGLNTQMIAGGRKFSKSFAVKVTLARCVIQKPKLLIIGDILNVLEEKEQAEILQFLCNPANGWTLLLVSNDNTIHEACDKIVYLHEGEIAEIRYLNKQE